MYNGLEHLGTATMAETGIEHSMPSLKTCEWWVKIVQEKV